MDEDRLTIAARNIARRKLAADISEKFQKFSSQGQALFVHEFLAVRELVLMGLNEPAQIRLIAIDLTPYEEAHPDWPQIKQDIIELFP